jgi:DNA-binding CsgD family transcriptional regulator
MSIARPHRLSSARVADVDRLTDVPVREPAEVIQLAARRGGGLLEPREQQALELTASGLDTTEIAPRLSESEGTFISPATVESCLYRARARLNARSFTHAVVIALRMGLIDPCEPR